jgi:polysaccharide deacetylase 2 family uncharacterized protein YibQ
VEKKLKKNRKEEKKVPKKLLFGAFLFIVGIIITTGIYFYLESSLNASSPVFEETFVDSSNLKIKIGKIDSAIYEVLYKSGIPENAVFFSVVEPRHENGNDWDFTAISIKLSSRDLFLKLNGMISASLNALNSDIGIHIETLSSHEMVCHVSVSGHYTHDIKVIYDMNVIAPPKKLPRISIIIDDLGHDFEMAKSFMEFELPLGLSVLPLSTYTRDIALEANKRGCELLLHIPMEPKGYPGIDPGPGALSTSMNEKELVDEIEFLVRQIPGVIGANNHMGSYFSERQDKMSVVLKELKDRNLFYVDSRTTAQTVGYDLAKKMGVPAGKKSTFLDNDLSLKAMRFQMELLMGMARYSGKAIGIGHPHKETLVILKEYLQRLKTEFNVVPVSEMVD